MLRHNYINTKRAACAHPRIHSIDRMSRIVTTRERSDVFRTRKHTRSNMHDSGYTIAADPHAAPVTLERKPAIRQGFGFQPSLCRQRVCRFFQRQDNPCYHHRNETVIKQDMCIVSRRQRRSTINSKLTLRFHWSTWKGRVLIGVGADVCERDLHSREEP